MKWWDESWNPVTGCTPISEGCKNCYAKRMTDRNLWGYDFTPRYHPERLNIPRKWKKPRRIFVCSMGDLFHEDITDVMIACILSVITMTPQHTYMILTKRPKRMKEFFSYAPDEIVALPNVWLGVTAENQARADERIPILLDTPTAHRFVSIEPMLSSVDIEPYLPINICDGCGTEMMIPAGGTHTILGDSSDRFPNLCGYVVERTGLDWIIVGGETGSGNRYMLCDWARAIRGQCAESGTPFFMKQLANRNPIPDDLMIREMP